ncbi:hypothetical protein D9619_012489 [Psilocybe cf. subviscida]|uniref:Uncharacterized protein n=1 Tax=Psilocybe cf. subviscida TaxID=2480587 RepID=A0A8H5AR03_9AGAR|nr:hypothetical protein D9619_012489 [Psilocybe cf. subviscida]
MFCLRVPVQHVPQQHPSATGGIDRPDNQNRKTYTELRSGGTEDSEFAVAGTPWRAIEPDNYNTRAMIQRRDYLVAEGHEELAEESTTEKKLGLTVGPGPSLAHAWNIYVQSRWATSAARMRAKYWGSQ